MDFEKIKKFLTDYDGPQMNIMEVCGSHTAAIAKNGIPGILSKNIRLLSGPGCPVCVTPTSYIDKLLELAGDLQNCIVTFGDLLRVPGSEKSLQEIRGEGAHVEMVYSPLDLLTLAGKNPDTNYIFAAVGFETTTPVYALLMEQLAEKKMKNVKLLTALKTMPEAITYLCEGGAQIDGFLAPGHVSVVTGSRIFEPIAKKYGIPFGVSGFGGEELLVALCGIVKAYQQGKVMNFYPSVVTETGNEKAQALISKYFEPCDATWRGMGKIPGSGRVLRKEYEYFDAGSRGLDDDKKKNAACHCDEVLMGKIRPTQCPLYGKVCTPMTPQGACMVSTEGSCFSYFANKRNDK